MKLLSRHPLARLVCLFGLVHGLVGADCCGLDVPRSPYSVTNDTPAVLNISCGTTTTMGVLPGEFADCEDDKGPLFEVRITAAVGSSIQGALHAKFDANCTPDQPEEWSCGTSSCLGGRVVLNDSNEFEFIPSAPPYAPGPYEPDAYVSPQEDARPDASLQSLDASSAMSDAAAATGDGGIGASDMSVVSLDASTAMLDTGSPTSDASSAAEDASMMSADANATPIDATPRLDAGEAAADLSLPGTDASATPPDANMP